MKKDLQEKRKDLTGGHGPDHEIDAVGMEAILRLDEDPGIHPWVYGGLLDFHGPEPLETSRVCCSRS